MEKKKYIKPTVIFYEIGNLADEPDIYFYSTSTCMSYVKRQYGIYDFDFDFTGE